MESFKKATWYGMEGKSTLAVYLWYRKQFLGKDKDDILNWQVEPETIGEKAQADCLGVSLETLILAKSLKNILKVEAWKKVLENGNRNVAVAVVP